MRRSPILLALLLALPQTSPARADLIVNGSITSQANGSNFDYEITLTNSALSTDSVRTFWYAWVPGKDFLATNPLSVAVPSGWSEIVTHFPNVPTNGYAIQWVTSTAPVDPGQSQTFRFTSADSPASVNGDSVFFPGTPVGTSFVYSGAPFQGASAQFVVAAVPEPGALTLGAVGALACGVFQGVRRAAGRRGPARPV